MVVGAGAVEFILCHAEVEIAFIEEKKIGVFFFKTQYFPRLTFSTVAMKQTLFSGFVQMAAGLSVGLSCLAGKINYIYI